MKRYLVLAAILFGLIQTAQAEEFHPYLGGGLGAAFFDIGQNVPGASSETVLAGYGAIGVDYGKYIGAELRIGTTSTASITIGGVSFDGTVDYFFSYLAKLQFPVTEQLRIYALGGGTNAKTTTTITTPGFVFVATGTTSISESSSSGSFGGGVDFQITDQLNLGAEWMRYASDVDAITANLKFYF